MKIFFFPIIRMTHRRPPMWRYRVTSHIATLIWHDRQSSLLRHRLSIGSISALTIDVTVLVSLESRYYRGPQPLFITLNYLSYPWLFLTCQLNFVRILGWEVEILSKNCLFYLSKIGRTCVYNKTRTLQGNWFGNTVLVIWNLVIEYLRRSLGLLLSLTHSLFSIWHNCTRNYSGLFYFTKFGWLSGWIC